MSMLTVVSVFNIIPFTSK